MRLEVTKDLAGYKRARARRVELDRELSSLRSDLTKSTQMVEHVRGDALDEAVLEDHRYLGTIEITMTG